MNPTIFFSICSIFYCILLLYMLFSKTEEKTVENKILKILTTINLFSLLCEGAGMFLGNNYERLKLLNDITLKLMLVLYIAWFSFFVLYVLNLAKNYKTLSFKKDIILYIIMGIGIILACVLPIIYITNDEGVIIYSTGMAVQLVYYYAMAASMTCLFIMFKHAKQVKVSNYTSLFALVVLSTLAAAIQSRYPSLLLTASSETFVMYIAYLNMKKRQLNNKK